MTIDLKDATFQGYERENGRIGVRNHVVVLPVDDLSNAVCEAVANNIKGTLAIPHPYGRLQFGADLELHFRTLIGTGSNPNVAAVVVIGIEDGWAKRVADGIAKTGKPVSYFGIEGHGDMETVRLASKAAKEYVHWASELQRGERPLKDLWVSTKCGESDTTSGIGSNPCVGNAFDKLYPHGVTLVFGETTELTGGEQLVAARCRTPQVRSQFMAMFNRYQDVVNRHKTGDLMDSQPTKGNIAGGLTTIEEKALGNIQKIGRKCVVDGVLDKAEVPTGPGLWFMDSSSARGCFRHHAARDQHGPGGRQAAGDDVPHGQRPAHRCRGAGPPRIRPHAPVRECLTRRFARPLGLRRNDRASREDLARRETGRRRPQEGHARPRSLKCSSVISPLPSPRKKPRPRRRSGRSSSRRCSSIDRHREVGRS